MSSGWAQPLQWSSLTPIITSAIQQQVSPSAVAIVGNLTTLFYAEALGSFTYGLKPPLNPYNVPVKLATLYDLASCSKIVGATTAAAFLYQDGLLDINAKVSHYLGEAFNANGKANVTVLNCLLHDAGFPPDPSPLYYSPQFGCPQTLTGKQPLEDFSCQQRIFDSLLNQSLASAPSTQYVYSDLSFITLANVVGSVAKTHGLIQASDLLPECVQNPSGNATFQCYYEAYTRIMSFPRMGLLSTFYRPPSYLWQMAAPAENYTAGPYFYGTFQGQVSDQNAYAMGGVAGHAGIFSNGVDLVTYARNWMFNSDHFISPLSPSTQQLFRTDYQPSFSSRALGFNTCNPNSPDECWNLSCGTLSASTFMHIGYTGTEICMDPVRQIFTILLTNRIYPDETHSASSIHTLRSNFNTQVQKIFDSQ
ncbi:MAG: serine hydrolase domain-containing protein [archaeon]|nr:serine hydrolase domain-containing protein [archaeon]